uniref:Uncharacterized protein n=1 Tax=Ditylenchus dipsaci TaxID=166011 RepID=A0A915D7P5_9BILA
MQKKISAAAMLKMEEHLGKDALDDTMDDEALESPLDAIYQELGIGVQGLNTISTTSRLSSQYPVYTPKSSSEYFSVRETPPLHYMQNLSGNHLCMKYSPTFQYNNLELSEHFSVLQRLPSYKQRADEEYRKNNRQTLIDYKEFDSSPLSPYMYQAHPYVQRQDSRIVGSNFVQLTSRPRDRFLEKLDETLADIRSTPRYSY